MLSATRPAQGDIWREQTMITIDDQTGYWGFGLSVALDCDTALIGSLSGPYVHMFSDTGATWQEVAKLPAPFVPSEYALFGLSLALDDGTGLVGSYTPGGSDASGAVSANIFVSTSWGMGAVPLSLPSQSYDEFLFLGNLALEGNLAVVGSPGDNETGNLSGAVYLFENTGSDVIRTRLAASAPVADGGFGHGLALDGDRLVIGAPGEDCDTGAVYVFEKGVAGWTQKARFTSGVADSGFGTSVALDGDAIVVGAPADNGGIGVAYVYEKIGTTWTQTGRLSPLSRYRMYSAGSVDIDGGYVVVGVLMDNHTGDMSGAAYVYRKEGGAWTEVGRLHASDSREMNYFGFDVAIEGDRMLVGCYSEEGSGGVYVFGLEGDNADMNADGKVDSADLAIWQQNYDPVGEDPHWWDTGDCNGDGKVDSSDLAIWQQQYDPVGSAAFEGTQRVPEPATITLLALGALMMRRRRR